MLDGDRPVGLRCHDGEVEVAPLPEVRVRRARALATAIAQPFDRSAGLVFFGAIGLLTILVARDCRRRDRARAGRRRRLLRRVKTLVTVDPNPEVQQGP